MKLFKTRVGENYVAAYYRDNKKASTRRYTFMQTKNGDYVKYYRVLELTKAGAIAAPIEVSIGGDTAYVFLHGEDIYPSLARGFVEFLTGKYVVISNESIEFFKFYLEDKD